MFDLERLELDLRLGEDDLDLDLRPPGEEERDLDLDELFRNQVRSQTHIF